MRLKSWMMAHLCYTVMCLISTQSHAQWPTYQDCGYGLCTPALETCYLEVWKKCERPRRGGRTNAQTRAKLKCTVLFKSSLPPFDPNCSPHRGSRPMVGCSQGHQRQSFQTQEAFILYHYFHEAQPLVAMAGVSMRPANRGFVPSALAVWTCRIVTSERCRSRGCWALNNECACVLLSAMCLPFNLTACCPSNGVGCWCPQVSGWRAAGACPQKQP